MTGLRYYTTLDPNQWRFPRWKEFTYYPAGSFVATVDSSYDDSEQSLWTFWVSTVDVTPITDSERGLSNSPADSDSDWDVSKYKRNPWSMVFDSNLNEIADRINTLLPLFALLGVDSDINILYGYDSDSRKRDSDHDSDILMEKHDRKSADSDMKVDLDSDLARAIHDSNAADSDIYEFIKLRDSENDSDHRMEVHDRMAADSDIYEFIKLKDSDNDSDYRMEVHDRKAADSDIYAVIGIHDSEVDSDIRQVKHDFRSFDSDMRIVIADNDSEIKRIIDSERLERKSNDSDILDLIADTTADLDSDIAQAFHDSKADDSDIRVVIKDNDSEIKRMLDSEIHDRKAEDSELHVKIRDLDSENKRMHDSDRHDWKADDSDLQIQIFDNDSDILMEIHDRKGADSDVRIDMDSEILRLDIRGDSDSDRLTNYMKQRMDRDSDYMVRFADIDSDIRNVKLTTDGLDVPAGFPVGSIQAFAMTDLPPGFQLCDGREFNSLAYPDLFDILGTNRLPDLRNQFIRGWNNDSDGYGNARAILSQQDDEFRSHTHTTNALKTGGGIAYSSGPFSMGEAENTATGGDETRPTNVVVAYGIAMYKGAGLIHDSDLIESVVRVRLADYDSDITYLYQRVDYHSFFLAPDSEDLPYGFQYNVGIPTEIFGDIEVNLNGVGVTQWTLANDVFTFNFVTRANLDRIDVKMRR